VRGTLSVVIAIIVAAAQLPAQTVSGRVYDSVAKAPLAGATVQLLPSIPGSARPIETTSDSLGRYTLTDVSPGKYVLGFYHAVLDSIGIEPPFVRIDVGSARGSTLRMDLAVPGPSQIIAAVCGAASAKDSSGVVLGHLYDAATRGGVESGSVIAEWRSFGVVANKLKMANPQLIATTAKGGGFAICGVPRGDDVVLEAARGGDTTGAVTVRVPEHGLARRELFVDKNEMVSVAIKDSLGVVDTTRGTERVLRGHSRLTGTVVDANSKQPITGAQVSISGAALVATTNDRGAFVISGAPGGTHTVLVRAVRYAPEQRTVDLLGETPLTIDVRLTTLKKMLDTIRVTASRVYTAGNGFEQRRVSGFGTYIDAKEIERTRPFEVTRMLRSLNGVDVVGSGFNQKILMRGVMDYCQPSIVIDGVRLPDFTGADLNMMVAPEDIAGLEVYTSAGTVPAQFRGLSTESMRCGAVVVWTKRSR
jgi:carboxypeptidase family protein/TonB-dependent receptor-like protein